MIRRPPSSTLFPLHDALPISVHTPVPQHPQLQLGSEPPKSGLGSEIPIPLTRRAFGPVAGGTQRPPPLVDPTDSGLGERSEEHTSELQSRRDLVCRLLLEKKK